MINKVYELLGNMLTRLVDTQSRVARIETRLMRLAEALNINVTKQETNHEHK